LESEPTEIPLEKPATAPEAKIDAQEEKPTKKPKDRPYQPLESRREGELEGAAEVETGGGTPFAGAIIDNATFDYPYWFTQAFYKIQSNWRNPVAADYSIVCVVYFQVIKSGRVIELRIEEPSGIRTYDEACLRSVEHSAPFPPLPSGFRDEIIGITLPFKYEP
jgi:TonB family protein